MGNGLNYSTGGPLVPSLEQKQFAERLTASLLKNGNEVASLTDSSARAASFRGEVERQAIDIGDTRNMGWTFLVNAKDPRKKEIIEAIRPLAAHRGMRNPDAPLVYDGEDWWDWHLENYSPLGVEAPPHYILIVGDPAQVPFRFQSILDSMASVGRLDFESIADLRTYAEKLVRLERAKRPTVKRETLVFATDGGAGDATYFSRRYMAQPLTDYIQDALKVKTKAVLGDAATKEALVDALRGARPALLYSASHGLGAPDQDLSFQRAYNGAICCQQVGDPTLDDLFSAEDVPPDEPLLEGAVVFQFACHGGGTPAESDFGHWLGDSTFNAKADFVAALPKRLLAHPEGPIAFIGHVDTAFLHGFLDPDHPHIITDWDPRIAPFKRALDQLLRVQPIGLALADLNKRYDICNALLTQLHDLIKRGKTQMTEKLQARLVNTFITRTDAQNYLILGDPAARLRLPEAAP